MPLKLFGFLKQFIIGLFFDKINQIRDSKNFISLGNLRI